MSNYNTAYEYNNAHKYSCYYLNLQGYCNNGFGRVRFYPPLSDAIVYKDVHYRNPNYNSLAGKQESSNLVCGFHSIQNAYPDACSTFYTNKCENKNEK